MLVDEKGDTLKQYMSILLTGSGIQYSADDFAIMNISSQKSFARKYRSKRGDLYIVIKKYFKRS